MEYYSLVTDRVQLTEDKERLTGNKQVNLAIET